MTIRKLTSDDAPAFREIRIEMCRLHPEAFGQTPEEVAEMPDEKFIEWMAPSETCPEKFVVGWFEGERLVGTVAFRRADTKKEIHNSWVWSVYVRPEGRGKKIAKQLMEYTIAEARKMEGLEMMTLTVAVTQTSARTLYTSLGFITYGLVRDGYKLDDGRYIDHEEMALWLKK
jgi:ribosomal protein S18 acetylase RimI-like enzyme